MKDPTDASPRPNPSRQRPEHAGVRIGLATLLGFALGAALSAAYFHSAGPGPRPKAGEPAANGGQAVTLSAGTRSILKNLPSPVQVRYYSLLDPDTTSDSLRALAARADRLLSAYEAASNGKLQVVRHESNTNFNAVAAAAAADGIRPFNMEKGQACYLGVAVSCDDRKQSLARLWPDWEPALEADLSRAIERVSQPAATSPAASTQPSAATLDEIKRTIPDVDSVSLQEGTRLLREAAMNQYKAAAAEMQQQIEAATQHLNLAQRSGSVADQQAAMRDLRQLQAQQLEKLRQIAEKSEAQIQAFQQLKSSKP